MTFILGIDGGGSTVRAVIITPDLYIVGQATGGRVNPQGIGVEAAAHKLKSVTQKAVENAGIQIEKIAAAGVCIAGTDTLQPWLRRTMEKLLPKTVIVCGIDADAALTGAFGERVGMLLIAGTGSIAYGVDQTGKAVLVGGWGYTLGDEGSGYWIGLQLLKHYTRVLDKRESQSALTDAIAHALNINERGALVRWMYDSPRTSDIASLAPLAFANADHPFVAGILDSAAHALHELITALRQQVDVPHDRIAFSGGLLSEVNPLSQRVMDRLGLTTLPIPKYPPEIGAAIIAIHALKAD